MPLDPQVEAFLAQTPPRPSQRRRAPRDTANLPRDACRHNLTIPGDGGDIELRIYVPPGERPLPVLVYFHGGGWVTGDLDVNDTFCRMIAEWMPCIVVSSNYRHAPEHVLPAAIDDAYAATCWTAENLALPTAVTPIASASPGHPRVATWQQPSP